MKPNHLIQLGSDPTINLRFTAGDTLSLTGPDHLKSLHKVLKRKKGGYLLKHEASEEQRFWSDEDLFNLYLASHLEHFRSDLMGLEEAARELLELEFSALDTKKQRIARFRELFCREVDYLADQGMIYPEAFDSCREKAFASAKESPSIWVTETPHPKGGNSKPIPICAPPPEAPFKTPSWFAVRNWHKRWVESGKDVRSLIPRTSRCGNRDPRHPDFRWKQCDPNKPLCVYGAMDLVARTVYMKRPRVSKQHAYNKLKEICAEISVKPVDYSWFCKYLKKRFNAFTEFRHRHGSRAAYYAFRLFERRTDEVGLLEEFEIDHTLIDRVVIDVDGRRCRPWLTMVIDRATRMVMGFHIGFDWPSYATVQRALIHAIAVKDLSGLPHLQNPWPCHGIPAFVITDRGLEFLSTSLKNACGDLNIELINLPGRCPHMKGAIERFFGTMGIQVFDINDGAVKSRVENEYDPYKRTNRTLRDLTEEIVRWIVDEYHMTEHATLGTTPLQRWNELAAQQGITPIGNLQRMVTLFGERVRRSIHETGILNAGHYYQSEELEKLRFRHGSRGKEWEIRADPYDRGQVWVLDDENERWLTVPAVFQKTSRGFSKYACKLHRVMARSLASTGGEITPQILEKAVAKCEREQSKQKGRKAARYFANGDLPTPVLGSQGVLGSIMDTAIAPPTPLSAARLPDPSPELPPSGFDFHSVMRGIRAAEIRSDGAGHA